MKKKAAYENPLIARAVDLVRMCFYEDCPADRRAKMSSELGDLCKIAAAKGWAELFEAVSQEARAEADLRYNKYRGTVTGHIRWMFPYWERRKLLVKERWGETVGAGHTVDLKSFEKLHLRVRKGWKSARA